jgi:hypothetical protein
MKKMLFGLIATVFFGLSSFANTQTVEKQKSITIENCNEKFNAKYNLGNISNLTESELISMCENLVSENFDFKKEVDECTISFTAEVNVGFGSVSVTVSYTASDCDTARRKASAALARAVKELKAAF